MTQRELSAMRKSLASLVGAARVVRVSQVRVGGVSVKRDRRLDAEREAELDARSLRFAWAEAARLEAKNGQLRDAVEAAHANVKAAMDPSIDGHLGLLRNAESMLREVLGDA